MLIKDFYFFFIFFWMGQWVDLAAYKDKIYILEMLESRLRFMSDYAHSFFFYVGLW